MTHSLQPIPQRAEVLRGGAPPWQAALPPAAPDLAFAGGGLDRAAHLRKPEAQAALRADPRARVLVLWRGMPLVAGGLEAGGHEAGGNEAGGNETGAPHLAWLALDHPILAAAPAPLFLGLAPDIHGLPGAAPAPDPAAAARFCLDLSACWQPPPATDPAANGPIPPLPARSSTPPSPAIPACPPITALPICAG